MPRMPCLRWCLLGLILAAAQAEDLLIVNPSVPVESMEQVMLRDLFLGRRTTWSNGQRVVVVLQRDGPSNERLASELGKTPQQLVNWWKRLVFTGEGNMPELVSGREELIARVAATPGAVGWIEDAGGLAHGVRAVSRH